MTRDSIEHLNTFGLAVGLFVIRNNQYVAHKVLKGNECGC